MSKTKIATNLFFLLGFIILGFMVYRTGIDVIWRNIKLTNWWFVAIIGIWAVVYFINALAFHTIIRDGSQEARSIGFLRTLKLTISGYAINLITPFGLMGGEPYKIIELQPALGIQKATSTVLLYMMMHFVSHFIFWMISIPLLFLIVPNVGPSVRIILAIAGIASLAMIIKALSLPPNRSCKNSVCPGKRNCSFWMVSLLIGKVTSTSIFFACRSLTAASSAMNADSPASGVALPSSIRTSSLTQFSRLIFPWLHSSAWLMIWKLMGL
jgi:hypothetical protein